MRRYFRKYLLCRVEEKSTQKYMFIDLAHFNKHTCTYFILELTDETDCRSSTHTMRYDGVTSLGPYTPSDRKGQNLRKKKTFSVPLNTRNFSADNSFEKRVKIISLHKSRIAI